jgi:hypothetical protein
MSGMRPGRAKGPWVGSVIDATEVTGAANVGTGTGQSFRDEVAHILNFKTIKQGTGITVTNNADDITITCTVSGESTTVVNVGTGTGLVYKSMTGAQINLKSIKQGTGITVTNNADDITITASGIASVANVGTGTGLVWRDTVANVANLKSIKQGTGITVTNNADDITVTCTITQGITAVANVGTGTGNVWRDTVGTTANLKTIKQGTGITVTNNADDVTVTCTVSGESTTVVNVGTGTGLVYKSMTGAQINLKSIKQGTNITVTNNTDDITITASGSAITSTGTNPFIPFFSPNGTSLANSVLSQYTNVAQYIIGFNQLIPKQLVLPSNFNTEANYNALDLNSMLSLEKTWMVLFGADFFGTAQEWKNGMGYVRVADTFGPGRAGLQISSIVSGTIYGVTLVNETEKSWEFLTALKMMGVGNTGGNSYDGNASSATPTTIDVSGLSAIRLQNSTGDKLYFKFTNALDNQVLTVYNVSDYAVKIQVTVAVSTPHHTIYPRKNEYDTSHAILVFSPFMSTTGGGWCMQGQDEMFFTITSSSNLTAVNAASGDRKYSLLLGENTTLSNPTNPLFDGQKILFRIKQGGAGSYTLAFGTKYRFSTSLPSPTLTPTLGRTDYFGFMYHLTDDKWDYIAQVQNFT